MLDIAQVLITTTAGFLLKFVKER